MKQKNGNSLQINGLRTWIEVDRGAIKHNVGLFKKLIGRKTKFMGVVKSNAYGHSLIDFSRELEDLGADFLGVDSVVEALALRKNGITLPILVLGYTLPEMMGQAVQEDISLTVSTLEILAAISKMKLAQPIKIHLKVDTGMHRQGFQLREMRAVVSQLKALNAKHLIALEGVYTHFAAAKNPSFPGSVRRQMQEFEQWSKALGAAGFSPLRHVSATASAILFPDSHLDMVRIGIGLYGLWPSKEVRAYAEDHFPLRPALSWKAQISEVKRVSRGEAVGYDETERLDRDSAIAVIPIGYWHGFPRALSSIGRLLIRGKRSRVVGRVSMDMIVADVTDIPGVRAGDEVVLIGTQGKESISADEVAQYVDTVHYEIVTRLNPLIKRLFV